jgi:hypothetical protein|nr:MAG: hypothetical protein DIU60_04025 [Actinomycetota bacterium]
MAIDGALGAAVVDLETGMCLRSAGGGDDLDIELAVAGTTEVARAKAQTLAALEMDDKVEDMLISLTRRYHVIRRASRAGASAFLYLVLGRHQLRRIEGEPVI